MDIEKFSLNYWLFYQVNHHRHPVLDVFYRYFYLLGKGWFGALLGVLLLLTEDSRLVQYTLALLLQALVVKVLKYTFRAKRPSATLRKVYALERLRLKSFPSGDTAMATTIALSLIEGSPHWLKPALLLYPLLIGYGRVYMGAHFPLDVVAGWTVGVLCSLLVSFFY
ncbi:MAG: phosphatase PAP2 family protein [Aquificaceae bacterium]|nr:phosphatase PAP2 family protein [Aquificaceae bacterium]MCX8060229.1 phosphatase PAP2 family protein [Aquificaceae bacterium]MDW8096954.1 phosphatase PAP2 family protein [Aquificaceae bacterium]